MDGGCFCGQVRYRLLEKPMFVNCCHCSDCQCQTGGAFAINAIIETANVEILDGTPVPQAMPTSSGRPHIVWRCETCQTALWSDYGAREVMIFVRVQTLDKRHTIKPDAHIFIRSKVPWVTIPDDQPAFEIFYDLPTQWSAESLARREALNLVR
ncbi:GFA family protein [Parvularcula flava]|uniref:Aldehyde-activating protein n=1 Tax=Aquisalinus luteolus TaxID=1566827 RepID=A0A8J3A6J8_9PROT|nr:GFA family protein [Aquisalinus luteolus]NHK29296.1 GFA family protein [Aquisalinus luteolus]GGI01209.1 aldehyde-activating protein [Aquisalinus luteolus]